MSVKKLLVFIGKPGAGKTTLINQAFPDKKIIDVLPFVMSFKVAGKVPEEKTIIGYRNMYRHLQKLDDDFVILELGTNHADFNVAELKKISQLFPVQIYLCVASNQTLRERIQSRNRGDDMEAMERRLQRVFPDDHITLLERAGLSYTVLDMEKPLATHSALIEK
ncbi:MAG: hypothetical protein WC497_01245 [Patescibacteria group bacterium]